MSRTFLAKWRNAVRDAECLDSSAKLVAFTLSTYMDRDGVAWPAKTTLATKASLSVRAVDGAVNRLEASLFLAVSRSAGRAANRYRALLPTPHDLQGSDGLNPAFADAQPRSKRHPTPHQLRTKALESNRKRATAGTVTVEVSKAQNCGVAKTPFEAAERWFEATGQQMVEEDALEMLTHHYGLSELESRRLLRQAKAEVA